MRRLFCILFCLSLWSCSGNDNSTPENLIPEEKMVLILSDIHIVEAQIERRHTYPDTAIMSFNAEQEKVLKKYGVNQEQFRETYDYYLSNLPKMDKLYEIIVDTLSVREAKVRSKSGAPAQLDNADDRMVEPDIMIEPEMDR